MSLSRRTLVSLVVAGTLCAVVLAAALILPLLIDVNRYKPVITEQIRAATGRSVDLGTMSLAVLPSPSLSVGPLRVSDSALYPARDALSAETLSIRVGLLPLLRGRVIVKSIVLKKPTLTLIRDVRGRWNFDDLLLAANAASPAPAGTRPPASTPVSVAVERARVVGGKILLYDDFVTPGARAQLVLTPVDATISGWGGSEGTAIDLAVGLGKSLLQASARLTTTPGSQHLAATAKSKALRADELALLLPWTGFVRLPGMQVGGSVDLAGAVELPLDRPERLRFKGSLVLHDLSYRDATMTKPVDNLAGTLQVDGQRATWDGFTVRVGGSSISGRLEVEDFARPRVGFTLKSPRLDFNEIIATFAPPQIATKPSAPTPTATGDAGLLETVTAQGKLEVDAIRFLNFDLSGLKAGAGLAQGVLSLRDLSAGFYDGLLKGSAKVDIGRTVPASALVVNLEKVDIEPLLAAYDPGLKGLLRGRLTGGFDLTAAGADMDKVLGSVKGSGRLEMVQGSLASFSILKQLAALLEMAGGKGIGREETPFEYLRGTLDVAGGRARTGDLVLHATDLDLQGAGWVGLDATMNLAITTRFSEEATKGMVDKNARLASFAEKDRLTINFSLDGPLASPRFKLDTRKQVETAKEKAKENMRRRLQDKLLKQFGNEPADDGGP
jgi:AsmA protein